MYLWKDQIICMKRTAIADRSLNLSGLDPVKIIQKENNLLNKSLIIIRNWMHDVSNEELNWTSEMSSEEDCVRKSPFQYVIEAGKPSMVTMMRILHYISRKAGLMWEKYFWILGILFDAFSTNLRQELTGIATHTWKNYFVLENWICWNL